MWARKRPKIPPTRAPSPLSPPLSCTWGHLSAALVALHSSGSSRMVVFAYLRRCRPLSASCGTAPSEPGMQRKQKQRTKRGRDMKQINDVFECSLFMLLLLLLLRICHSEGNTHNNRWTPSKSERARAPAWSERRTSKRLGPCTPLEHVRRMPLELFTV